MSEFHKSMGGTLVVNKRVYDAVSSGLWQSYTRRSFEQSINDLLREGDLTEAEATSILHVAPPLIEEYISTAAQGMQSIMMTGTYCSITMNASPRLGFTIKLAST